MPFEIKDLTGLGQPITKLLEVISAGIGAVYKPIAIRREADAQAYAAKVLGEAEAAAEAGKVVTLANAQATTNLVLADANMSIEERVRLRQTQQETRRQSNIESIASAAVHQLPPVVSPKPVDDDWRTRFFSIAEDICSAEMQQLWGKILAGEVAQPGSFSLRTLELMRNISQKEALIFQRARYLATDLGSILKVAGDAAMPEFGLSYNDVVSLRDAGLLLDGDMLLVQFRIAPEQEFIVLGYNGQGLLIRARNKTDMISLEQLQLSNAGKELMALIDPVPQFDYLNKLAEWLDSKQYDLNLGIPGAPVESFTKIGTKPATPKENVASQQL